MPNWCSNELAIKGNPKEIAKLIKKVEITKSEATDNHLESIFSCHRIIPRPINKQDDWYEWNVANWGTKWDLIDVTLRGDVDSKEITYYFESAWSPIVAVVEALAKEFKKLSFTYTFYETGSDYWGEVEYKKGEIVSKEGGDVSSVSHLSLVVSRTSSANLSHTYSALSTLPITSSRKSLLISFGLTSSRFPFSSSYSLFVIICASSSLSTQIAQILSF